MKAAAIACHESQLRPWLRRTLADPEILALRGAERYVRVSGDPPEGRPARRLFPELS